MKRVLGMMLVFLLLLAGSNAMGADPPRSNAGWHEALNKAANETDLAQAIDQATLSCIPADEIIKAAVAAGRDPDQVFHSAIAPGSCPGACVCSAVRGAAEAGISPDIIIKTATEAGVASETLNRGLAASRAKADSWRGPIQKARAEGDSLEKAIAEPIAACISPAEVVKAAIAAGHPPYRVLKAAINAAGPPCLCDAVAGALAAGVEPLTAVVASRDAVCFPQEAEPLPAVIAPPPAVKERVVLRGVIFDYDRFVIKSEFRPLLDEAAAILKRLSAVKVMVEGHTCSLGTDAYNQRLSERRANAVRAYLIDKGIAAERLTPVGYGESKPIADNQTEEGRRMNRRVEFKIIQ